MYIHDGKLDLFIADLKPEAQAEVLRMYNVTFADKNYRDFLYGSPIASIPDAWFCRLAERSAEERKPTKSRLATLAEGAKDCVSIEEIEELDRPIAMELQNYLDHLPDDLSQL